MIGSFGLSAMLLVTQFETALDEGIRRYWNGEYEATIDVLQPACATSASSGDKIECYRYLAFSHVALADDEAAILEFTRLLSEDPGYRLDETLVSPKILSRFEQARQSLAQRVYEDGKAAYQRDDFSGAVELMDRTLALDPVHELAGEYRDLSRERLSLEERATAATENTAAAQNAEPPPADPDRIYRLSSDISRPVLLERVAPVYPRIARSRRIEGVVVLSVVIDREGRATQSKVIRSVDELLDRAALDAVESWRYRPATMDGAPVAVYGIIELSFQLEDS